MFQNSKVFKIITKQRKWTQDIKKYQEKLLRLENSVAIVMKFIDHIKQKIYTVCDDQQKPGNVVYTCPLYTCPLNRDCADYIGPFRSIFNNNIDQDVHNYLNHVLIDMGCKLEDGNVVFK